MPSRRGLALFDGPFGLELSALAQYPTGQDEGGEEMFDLGGFGQLPDDGNTPRRGRRPRTKAAASKKGRSTKDAADKSEKTKASATAKPAKERDQKIEAAGRDRWKQANPRLKPEIVPGDHFLLFSNLPRDRATATVKAMETQYTNLKRLVGSPAADWVEKVSLYVFNDRKDFVEFARTVEHREVSTGVMASGNLAVPQPYVVVVDPLGGNKEEPSAARRRPRGKKADEKEAAGGSDRTLIGLLTEQLGRLGRRLAGQVATMAGPRVRGFPVGPGGTAQPLLPAAAPDRVAEI